MFQPLIGNYKIGLVIYLINIMASRAAALWSGHAGVGSLIIIIINEIYIALNMVPQDASLCEGYSPALVHPEK